MNTIEAQLASDAAEILIEDFGYDPDIEKELLSLSDDAITSDIGPPDRTGFRRVDASRNAASSTKPSNIVEFDLEHLFLALGESGAVLSGDPMAVGSAIFVMCGLAADKLEKQLTVEAGFVYGVAYEQWGKNAIIKQSRLIASIKEYQREYRNPPELTTQEIHTTLDELDDLNCIDRDKNADGDTFITLNESCEFNWT